MSENIVRINVGKDGAEKSFAIDCPYCTQLAGSMCVKENGLPFSLTSAGLLPVHSARFEEACRLSAAGTLPNASIGCSCGQQMPTIALFMVDGKEIKCADCLTKKQEAPPAVIKKAASTKHDWDPTYES